MPHNEPRRFIPTKTIGLIYMRDIHLSILFFKARYAKERVINDSLQKQRLFQVPLVGVCDGLALVGVCGGLAAVGVCSGRDPSLFNDYPPDPSFLHFGV